MGRNYPLAFGVDSNGMLSKEIDDHINLKIYSMLGTCTDESLLKYQLAIAQKSVLLLQDKVGDLQGELQMQSSKHERDVRQLQRELEIQTVKYEKAKEEASLNARALKRSIATCELLKEDVHKVISIESSLEQRDQMHEFREEMETSMSLQSSPKRRNQDMDELRSARSLKYQILQDTNTFSGHHMKNIYVDGNRAMKRVHVTSEEQEDVERQSNWVDGRRLTKKRLLQELDPNIEDLGCRVAMPESSDKA